VFALLAAVYVALVAIAAREPDLKMDDPNARCRNPLPGPTYATGLHYVLPVDRAGLGADGRAAVARPLGLLGHGLMMFILVTQRPLKAFFRGRATRPARSRRAFKRPDRRADRRRAQHDRHRRGHGHRRHHRGAVTRPASARRWPDWWRCCRAATSSPCCSSPVLSLILGMGLPTTANYIVVSALLAPVVVTLGAAERADRAADRGASLRVLFRDHGGRDAAGGAGEFRRGGGVGGRSDQDRLGGVLLLAAHRGAAVPVHLQPHA
jgi:hypothetical protein